MDRSGSQDMKHLADLVKSRPFGTMVPDQSIIASAIPEDGCHYQAARGDGFAFIYNPYGKTFSVNLNKVGGSRLRCCWFSPRDGSVKYIGRFRSRELPMSFDPPGTEQRGNDWILVNNYESKKYADPGTN